MIERDFVGRVPELAALESTFTAPDAPWLLLVEGPAGIGKSRLLAHFAHTAPCRVLVVTGTEDAHTHSRYLADDITDQLGRVTAPDGPALAAGGIVVGGAGRIAAPGGPPTDPVRWMRWALGAVETLLVVDDVQWADSESLRVLAALIRNRPRGLRVLLACRSGSCPAPISRLWRAPHVRAVHVPVPPFTEADVAGLLPEQDARRRERLLAASRGNPLYLSLLAGLPERELERALSGGDPDPSSGDYAALDRTIRAELAELPAVERLVAQAVAVCGVPPDLELVCATADLATEMVVAGLDGLVTRGVAGMTDGAVAFTHPLIRTAAYRLAPPAWRATAHRRAALTLRTREAPMPARARHLEHALLGPDDLAGTELRLAADQVLADAPEASARWLALAQRIAPDVTDPLADALALGWALLLSGAAARAGEELAPVAGAPGPHQLEALLLSARCARMLGRVEQARALLATAATLPRRPGDGPIQLELAILEMQDHQDTDGRARLSTLFATPLNPDPPVAAAAMIRAPAVAAATGNPDRAVVAAATALRCLSLLAEARFAEAAVHYDGCAAAFATLDDAELREIVHAVPAFGWCAYFLDRDVAGLHVLDRAITVSRRFGRSYALAELHTVRAYSLAKLGRLTEAIAAADDATDSATTFHYPDLLAFAGAVKLRTLQFTAPADLATTQWHTVAALPRPAVRWWRRVVENILTETAHTLAIPTPPATPDDHPGPLRPTLLARAAHLTLTTGDLPTAESLVTRAEQAAGLTPPTPDRPAAPASPDGPNVDPGSRPASSVTASFDSPTAPASPDGPNVDLDSRPESAVAASSDPPNVPASSADASVDPDSRPVPTIAAGFGPHSGPASTAGAAVDPPTASSPAASPEIEPHCAGVQAGDPSIASCTIRASPANSAIAASFDPHSGPASPADPAVDRTVIGTCSSRLAPESQVGAALLARADYDAAVGAWESAAVAATAAATAFGKAGMVVNRAQADLLAGIIAGRRGDFGAATSHFAAARVVFAEAGAQRLLTETITAQRRLAGSRRPGTASTLTRREREVAELAAHGHSTKDIAAHLYLSPRTVEDHLGRVLRKLGLTRRAGIARKLDELDSPIP
ncbi:AAA family ATPase [Nocardia sp. NPDC056064]|uniref:AAA family ATPase n=1 Tax=Nocardia sp. NPDC056064 TaxID=3345701 RepID=UPI0035DD4E1F